MGNRINLQGNADSLIREVDPFFEIDGNTGLMDEHKPATSHNAALTYLAARIKRHPTKLHHHIQRINLLLDNPDAVKLAAALVDLYISLGNRGVDLKNRMLNQVKPYLNTSGYEFFKEHIHTGLNARDPQIGILPGSMLSEGFSGRAELVVQVPAYNIK